MARDNDGSSQDAYIERMLAFLFEEGGAGATIGPDGLRLGIPDWHERTKHLRTSERVRTHGYPLGLAKSQHHLRDRVLLRFREGARMLTREQKHELVLAHEAMARALDDERFLGSFDRYGDDRFPVQSIDEVADNLIAWLDYQGFRVVPKAPESDGASLPEKERYSPPIVLWPEDPTGAPRAIVDEGVDDAMDAENDREADAEEWDADEDEDEDAQEEEEDEDDDDGYYEDAHLWFEGKAPRDAENAPTLLYYLFDPDDDSAIVLDQEAHFYVWKSSEEEVTYDDVAFGFNSGAASWCRGLRLSELQPGETPPPLRNVGQYGRHGCALDDGVYGWTGDSAEFVYLLPYPGSDVDAFVRELEAGSNVLFRQGRVDVGTYGEFASSFLREPGQEPHAVPGDERPFTWEAAKAAVAWGSEHARRLTANGGTGDR